MMRDGRVATTVAATLLAAVPLPTCTMPDSVTCGSSVSANSPLCRSIETVLNSCRTSCESDGGSTSATSSSVESAGHSGGEQATDAPVGFGVQPLPATAASATTRSFTCWCT